MHDLILACVAFYALGFIALLVIFVLTDTPVAAFGAKAQRRLQVPLPLGQPASLGA